MGFTGIDAYEQKQEDRAAARDRNNESPYFKLGPGEKIRFRPLVELGVNSKNYDPDKGTANFVDEYVNPVKFWLSIVDTYDPEANTKCVGGELNRRFGIFMNKPEESKYTGKKHGDKTKNWNKKSRWYLPALVDRLDGSEPTVEVFQFTYGPKSYSQTIVDFYKAKGSITDRWFDWSRNGEPGKKQEMADVVHTIIPDDPSKYDTSKVEVPNVNDAPYVNNVPYEDQWAFLQIDETYPDLNDSDSSASSTVTSTSSEAPKSASSEDEDW